MIIYDTFIYNNEDLILDIRLNYLNKFVEKFTYEMGDEHGSALFEGEGLEEEFKFKAKTIREAGRRENNPGTKKLRRRKC